MVIVPINAKDEALMTLSQRLYQDLMKGGDVAPADILLDDRNERAGVKFKDADLIGYPLRVTVSKKSLESNTVEVRVRKTGEVFDVPVDSFATEVAKLLADL